jgi:hypothetical protein
MLAIGRALGAADSIGLHIRRVHFNAHRLADQIDR